MSMIDIIEVCCDEAKQTFRFRVGDSPAVPPFNAARIEAAAF